MNRLVLLRIDDPDVVTIDVVGWSLPPTNEPSMYHEANFFQQAIPVPEDDQLMRDLDMVLTEIEEAFAPDTVQGEAAARLRAWAGLDEE